MPANSRPRPPAPRTRFTGASTAAPQRQPHVVKPAGMVRRSQLITTYGIGAIVDLEAGSFMPLGLRDWESATRGPSHVVYEARLQAQLGVDHFRLPPIAEAVDGSPGYVEERSTLPVVRFPEWHECPKCNRLGTLGHPFEREADGNSLVCNGCNRTRTNPVRFVIACRRGHIEEFPWSWWAHRKSSSECQNPVLVLKSHGQSAALADLFVRCISCGAASSLGDAFLPDTGRRLHCHGVRPWLVDREPCDAEPRVLQRGASNIHFPVVASALSIPPVSEPLFQLLDDQWSVLRALPVDAVAPVLESLAKQFNVDAGHLRTAYERKQTLVRGMDAYTELISRSEEYLALSATRHDEAMGGYVSQFRNDVRDAPAGIARWFDLVGAVSRLREVRCLVGFSRIEPFPVSGERIADAIAEGLVSPLSKERERWLPAAEIRGEGIFLRFRTEAVEQWIESNPAVLSRAGKIDHRARQLAEKRGFEQEYRVTPRLLLVHSFAHAMIRQLAIECGYSASALRERLYVAEPESGSRAMNGVLIYTGSPDSEGSLGGLVRLVATSPLERSVLAAIQASRWCGSDPVCLETDPDQAGDRVSGAACHCCQLLPETACEKFNRELDRSMLVGDTEGSWTGFFAG